MTGLEGLAPWLRICRWLAGDGPDELLASRMIVDSSGDKSRRLSDAAIEAGVLAQCGAKIDATVTMPKSN